MSQGFSIEELEMKSTVELPYLDDSAQSIAHITLYHTLVSDTRGVFALSLPMMKRGHIVVVTQGGGRQVTANSLLRYQRQIIERNEDGENFEPLQWEVEYAGSYADGCRVMQRLLTGFRQQHRGPVIAVTEGTEPVSTLSSSISGLADMPCVELPPSASDADLPTLGWQTQAANTAMDRCASSKK